MSGDDDDCDGFDEDYDDNDNSMQKTIVICESGSTGGLKVAMMILS